MAAGIGTAGSPRRTTAREPSEKTHSAAATQLRVASGRVRGRHSAECAEGAAGWIDGEAKAVRSRRRIDGTAQRAGTHPHTTMDDVDVADRVQAAEVDDDALSNRAARHSTSRPSRDQRRVVRDCPGYEL
jgi:hypothetical protein